ncbi:hypothetical protein T439DRAFT_355510 [Meredithblackwellia eburnea MCA 4105]
MSADPGGGGGGVDTTTITILDTRLRLVHVPRKGLDRLMSPILDCWWFRGDKDPFFALCLNGLEVSLFASSEIVDRAFGPIVRSQEKQKMRRRRMRMMMMQESGPGESGITVGRSIGFEEDEDDSEDEDDEVKVGEDEWVALEIAFHGDGWEKAGQRVRDISSPLAADGISILFLSTYISDYLLLQAERLADVTKILEASGFAFTPGEEGESDEGSQASDEDDEAAVDDDDEVEGEGPARSRGLSRSSTMSGSGRSAVGRKGSIGTTGSLAGSLVLSDRGSAGSGSIRSVTGTGGHHNHHHHAGSGSVTLSRSTSLSMKPFSPTTPSSASSFHSNLFTSSPSAGIADLPPSSPSTSNSTNIPPSPPPSLPATPPPGFVTPTAADAGTGGSSTPFNPSTSLSILPDELVCVGLNTAHEELWKAKLVQAIFFPERCLPRKGASAGSRSRSGGRGGVGKAMGTGIGTAMERKDVSLSRQRGRAGEGTKADLVASTYSSGSSSSGASSSYFGSAGGGGGGSALPLSASVSTLKSDYPVPFIALTQTIEGTSLTADVRLLRAIFKEDEEAEMIYAVGEGGLRGIWEGEEGVPAVLGEEEEAEVEGDAPSLKRRGSDQSDWQQVEREEEDLAEREARERRELAKVAGEGGRVLLKCICLDLWAFGLDKTGIVEHFAGLLIEQGINLVYTSTFQSANILVAKTDLERACRILERNAQIPT